jgi:hypothetical protein
MRVYACVYACVWGGIGEFKIADFGSSILLGDELIFLPIFCFCGVVGEFKIADFGMSTQLKHTLDPANT